MAEADLTRAGYQDLAAKGLMTIEELAVRLKELEGTRRIASGELEALSRRAERLEGLEQDRDALMLFYVSAAPEELARLKPKERHRVYRMLRLEVCALPDGTLEVRGNVGESLQVGSENGHAVCEPELALWLCGKEPWESTADACYSTFFHLRLVATQVSVGF